MRRRAAHGIDIGDGIGSGDLAEDIGIIHHRREEIDRLNQRNIIADLIDTGIVGRVKADKYVFVGEFGDIAQNLRKRSRRELCRSACSGNHLGQFDRFCHPATSFLFNHIYFIASSRTALMA
jgi:hypothetical protein